MGKRDAGPKSEIDAGIRRERMIAVTFRIVWHSLSVNSRLVAQHDR
jgi:hypothetical protein